MDFQYEILEHGGFYKSGSYNTSFIEKVMVNKMLKNLFKKREILVTVKNVNVEAEEKPNIPDGKWLNCDKCENIIYKEDLKETLMFVIAVVIILRFKARTRINYIVDKG